MLTNADLWCDHHIPRHQCAICPHAPLGPPAPPRTPGYVPHPTPVATTDLEKLSLKRLAWAYGCSKTGSEEEQLLRDRLLEKARLELQQGIRAELWRTKDVG